MPNPTIRKERQSRPWLRFSQAAGVGSETHVNMSPTAAKCIHIAAFNQGLTVTQAVNAAVIEYHDRLKAERDAQHIKEEHA